MFTDYRSPNALSSKERVQYPEFTALSVGRDRQRRLLTTERRRLSKTNAKPCLPPDAGLLDLLRRPLA